MPKLTGKNLEDATAWVAILRSGKYKQGANQLRTEDDSFCCLGVYCDALAPGEWIKKENLDPEISWESGTPWVFKYGYNEEEEIYYEEIYYFPSWMDGVEVRHVADMNDQGKTFDKIAAYIEARYIHEDGVETFD
jgi:hypothetical protein